MRGLLMTGLVSGALAGVFFWIRAKFITPPVPRWADAVLFSLVLGVAWVSGLWVAGALGGLRSRMDPTTLLCALLGALLGGLLAGYFEWSANGREPRKSPNP